MKNTDWKDIAELTGIAAIVGSLVFVGLQMKQSHEIALSEIYQQRTTAVAEWNTSMAANDHALSAFEKSASGHVEKITPEEARAARHYVIAAIFFYENSLYQYELGFLPRDHWERARRALKSNMSDPFWHESVQLSKRNFRPTFIAVLDEIDKELKSEASN